MILHHYLLSSYYCDEAIYLNSEFLIILNFKFVCHPSQLPIRAFMPWQLVIDSTVFNVSCY